MENVILETETMFQRREKEYQETISEIEVRRPDRRTAYIESHQAEGAMEKFVLDKERRDVVIDFR